MLNTPCICARLRRASQLATNLYDAALEDVGITSAQHGLLRAIRDLDRPHIGDLAQATGLDRSTLGRNLKLLEQAGMIALERGDDRRRKVIVLSAKADAALEEALGAWKASQREMKKRLGAEGAQALFALLESLEPEVARPDEKGEPNAV